jgi:nitrogen regulatory protein PII 2
MKEVIAIIRPRNIGPMRNALEQLGFPCMTATAVLGRGAQRGIAGEVKLSNPKLRSSSKSGGMKYIPKRLVSIVVQNSDVDTVVKSIVEVNQTLQIGDGKIFICPLDNAVRIRTNEQGESAVL